jgi:hypothetical protein
MPAWSYSALTSYETCPLRHYETRVAKTTHDKKGAPALLGDAGHKALELRASRDVPIPKVIQVTDADGKTESMPTHGWESTIERVLQAPGELVVERKIALNDRFQETDWFAKDAWVRGIIDFGKINGDKALLLDWKSGKRKPDLDQLELFSAFGFHVWPALEKIVTGFVWLKSNAIDKSRYSRADLPKIWDRFLPRVAKLFRAYEDNKWEPRPSGLCRAWCPCTDCKYNGRHGE